MSNLGGFVKSLRDIMRMDSGISGDAQRIEQISWLLFLKIYDTREEDWEFADMDYESIIPEEYRWRNWATLDDEGKGMTGETLLNFVNNELFPALKRIPVDRETPIKKAIVRTVFEDTNQYMKDGVQLRQVINVINGIDFGSYEETHAFGEIYESILKEMQSAGSAGEFYTPRAVTDFMAEKINPQIGEVCADFACGTGGFLTSWLKVLDPKVKTSEDREKLDESVYGMEKKQFPYTLCITNMLLHGIDSPDVHHGNSLGKNVLDYTDEDKFDCALMNPPYGGSEKNDIKSHFPDDVRSSETADLFMSVIMYRLKEGGRAAVILPDGFLFGTDGAKLAIKKKLLQEFNLHTVVRMPGSVFAPYTSITTNILFFEKNSASDGTGGGTKETWFYRLDMPEGYKHFSKTKPMKREHFAPVDAWWDNREEIQDPKKEGSTRETWKSRKYSAEEIIDGGYNLDLCGYPAEKKVILSPEETMERFMKRRDELDRIMDEKLAEIKSLLEVKG